MIFKCKACGGNLTYDVLTGRMRCAGCENTFTAGEIDKDNYTYFNATVCRCENCGAELITTDATEVTAFCSYCGTASVLTRRMERIKKPDYVLPFTVTKEQCKKAYLKEARRAPLAPDWMRDESSIDSFRGIYVPYWVYNIKLSGDFKASKWLSTERDGDYLVTQRQQYEGKLGGIAAGVTAMPASTQLSRDIAEHIGFTELTDLKEEFHPGYLAGFYADKAERVQNSVNTLIEHEAR